MYINISITLAYVSATDHLINSKYSKAKQMIPFTRA